VKKLTGKATAFKGNKQSLPTKNCIACERPMTWRKAWAKNWSEIKYCSDACRKSRPANPIQANFASLV